MSQPMGSMLRKPTTYLVLAAILLIAHAMFYGWLMGFDAVDDAYISSRYALNAAGGHGLTFNVGERRVEGYTNFLWTVMMIPVFWLELPVHTASLVLGLLCALGTLLLAARFAREEASVPWLGPVMALLLAADGSFALWAVGGMEAPLFALLVFGGALAYLREMRNPSAVPLSGAWFALAGMTRPEGVLIYGLTGLHQIATRLIDRKLATRQDWGRLGLFLLIWGPWFAFRWRYYGYPLPNTFYAKVTLSDTAAQLERGLAYVQTFAGIHLGILPLVVALLPLLRRGWRRWSSYFVWLVLAYTLYIAYVGGDWSVGRPFVQLMPMVYALLVGGLLVLGEWIGVLVGRWRVHRASAAEPTAGQPTLRPLRLPARAAAVVVVVAMLAGVFLQSSLQGEKALFLDSFDARLAGRARTALGKWLRDHVPEDTFIAVDAAGQIPFYSELKALDLYGLTNLQIAHSEVEMGSGTAGHEKMNMHYVISIAQPDYIIIYGTAFDWLAALSYERVDLPWTEVPELKAFLSIYERQ